MYTHQNPINIIEMYEQFDLGSLELFTGGFINFGYWEGLLSCTEISETERTKSQENLYRFVSKKCELSSLDKVLEIGCGKGVGLSIILEEFAPLELHGIDISLVQVERAKENNSSKKIFVYQGAAECIPYPDNFFTKICSIEALQHFQDLHKFGKEVNRVLKSGGKIAIATFFLKDLTKASCLNEMIPTFSNGIDKAIPVQTLRDILEKESFKNIEIASFGEYVWQGWDKWVSQTKFNDHWDRNWLKAYQEGILDYYIVTAQK